MFGFCRIWVYLNSLMKPTASITPSIIIVADHRYAGATPPTCAIPIVIGAISRKKKYGGTSALKIRIIAIRTTNKIRRAALPKTSPSKVPLIKSKKRNVMEQHP